MGDEKTWQLSLDNLVMYLAPSNIEDFLHVFHFDNVLFKSSNITPAGTCSMYI